MLFGAKTGRDGIGGASVLASAELDESEDKRPTVQIGDPFTEKKLLECSLELLDRGLLVALQDLGAAGLTSSSAEMAAKGEVGLDLDVRRVPLREADMEPFEIMIWSPRSGCSASSSRSSCRRCSRSARAGRSTAPRSARSPTTRRLRVFDGDELVGDLPVTALVDECPAYDLEPAEPATPLYPGAAGGVGRRRPGRAPARRCSRPRTSLRASGRSSSTTRSSARAPSAAPRPADAAVLLLPGRAGDAG